MSHPNGQIPPVKTGSTTPTIRLKQAVTKEAAVAVHPITAAADSSAARHVLHGDASGSATHHVAKSRCTIDCVTNSAVLADPARS
jgi:hypothetical protein